MQKNNITVMLPAFNEAQSIGLVIDSLKNTNANIIVGDNNSHDGTGDVASSKDVQVVTVSQQGKGYAVKEILGNVTTPYCVMVDSDNTYPVSPYIEVISFLLSNNFTDVVIVKRVPQSGSMSMLHKIGNTGLTMIADLLYGNCKDLCTGFWGFKTNVLKSFDIQSPGFTLEAELFIKTRKGKSRIWYLTCPYLPRYGTKSKLKMKHGLDIASYLFNNSWLKSNKKKK